MIKNNAQRRGTRYRIKLTGILDSKWSDWFSGFTITALDGNETLLVGTLADQSALLGLLTKIHDLGLPLLSVQIEE
jgi:hypothetical protein